MMAEDAGSAAVSWIFTEKFACFSSQKAPPPFAEATGRDRQSLRRSAPDLDCRFESIGNSMLRFERAGHGSGVGGFVWLGRPASARVPGPPAVESPPSALRAQTRGSTPAGPIRESSNGDYSGIGRQAIVRIMGSRCGKTGSATRSRRCGPCGYSSVIPILRFVSSKLLPRPQRSLRRKQ